MFGGAVKTEGSLFVLAITFQIDSQAVYFPRKNRLAKLNVTKFSCHGCHENRGNLSG